MSKGFTKGGIVSDVVIPYARMHTGPESWLLVFKWRRLFSWLFREEMLARKFRDKLLEDFLPKIEANKSAEERNADIYMFLRSHYLGRRRLLLAAFRRHVAWESRVRRADSRLHQSLDPHADSFDITPFLNQPPLMVANSLHTCYDSAMTNTSTEQSIVFQMPGWETWSMRQLAQLRLMDEYIVEERKSPKEWYYRDRRLPEEDTKGRKEKSEAALEKYLRGPSIKLNTKMFWEW